MIALVVALSSYRTDWALRALSPESKEATATRNLVWIALLFLSLAGCSRDPGVALAKKRFQLDQGAIEVSVFQRAGTIRISFDWSGENWPHETSYRQDVKGSSESHGEAKPEISLTPEGHILIRFAKVSYGFDPVRNRYLSAPAERH